jgi:hypothetical protein
MGEGTLSPAATQSSGLKALRMVNAPLPELIEFVNLSLQINDINCLLDVTIGV